MIVMEDDEMICLDEKIFLAYYEKVKEQLDLKEKLANSDMIIFESYDRSEETTPFIYDEAYGNEGSFFDTRYICTTSVFMRKGGEMPICSEKPYDVQLQEIRENYEKIGFQLPPQNLRIPKYNDNGEIRYYLLVVISKFEPTGYDEDDEDVECTEAPIIAFLKKEFDEEK